MSTNPMGSGRLSVSGNRQFELTLISGIAALGLALGFYNLGAKSLWLDETFSLINTDTLGGMWGVLQDEGGNTALYYLVLVAWRELFGDSEFALRTLSLLFTTATAVLICLLGRRLGGRWAGLAAAVLFLVNPLVVRYAQDVRGYSMLAMLLVCAAWWFHAALERRSWQAWLSFALFSSLAFLAHYFTLFVLAAFVGAALVMRPRDIDWRKALGAGALSLAVMSIPVLLFNVSPEGQLTYVARPSLRALKLIGTQVTAANAMFAAVFCVAASVALFAGLAACARVRRDSTCWGVIWFGAWAAVPVLMMIGISYVWKPIFLDRYLMIVAPGFFLLMGVSLAALRRPLVACLLGGAMLATQFSGAMAWYSSGSLENWPVAAGVVSARGQGREAVMVYAGITERCFTYYYDRLGSSSRARPVVETIVVKDGVRFTDVIDLARVEQILDRSAGVWLVFSHEGTRPEVRVERDKLLQLIGRKAQILSEESLTSAPGYPPIRILHLRSVKAAS